ncbi:hypothetical protein V8C37DRAFT_397285 [Trichoderma ceciliae]
MATSQLIRSSFVNLFAFPKKQVKIPQGFSAFFEDAQRAENTSTERLFADCGITTWIAYVRSKGAIESDTITFKGKADDARLLLAFEAETVEMRKSVAKEVTEVLMTQDGFDRPNSQKRKRTADPTAPEDPAEDNDDQQITYVQAAVTEADITIQPTNTLSNDSQFFFVTGIPASWVSTIFPSYLVRAIKKINTGADCSVHITMSFLRALRSDEHSRSMMSLKVETSQAEWFSWPLFGTRITSVDGRLCLLMPDGLKVMIHSEITLQGCRRDAILEVFGKQTEEAVKSSVAYKQEARQGNLRTDCITMTVPEQASDGVTINLLLEETRAIKLKDALYGKMV